MHVTSFALRSNNSALSKFTVFLQFYDWLKYCSLYGVWLGMGWVGSWVHKFTWQWVGLGQLFGGLGWVWVDDMDPRTTLVYYIRDLTFTAEQETGRLK